MSCRRLVASFVAALVLACTPGMAHEHRARSDPICPRAALEEALDLARRLGARSTLIFYLALDGVLCPGEEEAEYYVATLEAVRRRNPAHVPIHAIAIGGSVAVGGSNGDTACPAAPRSWNSWGAFLGRLALESGGEFVPIPYAR